MNTINSIQTYSGIFVDPFNFDPGSIRVMDIAHALSNQPRFGGHTVRPWTVAQHSMVVADMLPDELKLCGLLHDSSEAYLMDLPRPIKQHPAMSLYRDTEELIQREIARHFKIPWLMPDAVHEVDNLTLIAEAKVVFHGVEKWRSYPDIKHIISSDYIINIIKYLDLPRSVIRKKFADRIWALMWT